jgi:Flp pilus assembly protein TadG
MIRDRRGVAAVEAAIVISLAMTVSLGTLQLGMMSWTKAGLQATAAITARCVGIGSTACTGSNTGPSFAVTTSKRFLGTGSTAITTSSVTVSTATTCASAPGHYVKVAITSNMWQTKNLWTNSSYLGSVLPKTITVTACYTTATT